MAETHQQAKQQLEEQIKQKEKAGDLAGAGKLQQQLDQLKQQDRQMNKLQQMANKLAQGAQAMKDGDQKQAADQLAQLAEDLNDLQKEMDQLETVDEMMNEIADAKNAMNCKQCNGEGCPECQGQGQGQGQGMGQFGQRRGKPGNGLGPGQGFGERPEEKTDSGFYDTKVGAKPKAGESVRVGTADGQNIAGRTPADVQQEVSASLSTDPEPLTNQRLPRAQREHAKQYFEKFQPSKPDSSSSN
jgi:hypothetical protein